MSERGTAIQTMDILFSASEILKATGGKIYGTLSPSLSVNAISTDTRTPMPGALFLALSGENFDAHNYLQQAVDQGAAALCIEEDKVHLLPPDTRGAILVPSTVKAYQNLARFHRLRFPDLKVIALTGSCGKTSSKEILRAVFETAYGKDSVLYTRGNTNNQIGVPQNLLRLTSEHRIAIIEMGTNHPGEIEPLAHCAMPDASLVVSIGNCHLEFLGSLEGVAREKSHIFSPLSADASAVIPMESPGHTVLSDAVKRIKHVQTFGSLQSNADIQAEYLAGDLYGSSFRLCKKSSGESVRIRWSVQGRHQILNAAGAAAMADLFGIPFSMIALGIAKTVLPGMRMRIQKHHQATWINDAYNANPDSMKASLIWLSEFADPEHLVLILGDMAEIGEGSAESHLHILQFARKCFANARIIAVGQNMCQAAAAWDTDHRISTFRTPGEALPFIRQQHQIEDMLFLKASRSTHLEIVEQEF